MRVTRVSPEPVKVMVIGSARFVNVYTDRLRGRSRINVTGGATLQQQAVKRATLLRPDVVVIDIDHGFEMGGLDTAEAVRRVLPSAGFVIVSPYTDDEHLASFPAGPGVQWSYILPETAADPSLFAMAVAHASWSLRYVDPQIDARKLGAADRDIDLAVKRALAGVNEARPPVLAGQLDRWHGETKTASLKDDERPDAVKLQHAPQPGKETGGSLSGLLSRFPAFKRRESPIRA